IVLLRDTPRFPGAPMSCLSAHLSHPAACDVPASEAFGDGYAAADERLARHFHAQQLDFSAYLCGETCPLIQGDVLVFKDSHHISTTFSRAMAPVLAKQAANWR